MLGTGVDYIRLDHARARLASVAVDAALDGAVAYTGRDAVDFAQAAAEDGFARLSPSIPDSRATVSATPAHMYSQNGWGVAVDATAAPRLPFLGMIGTDLTISVHAMALNPVGTKPAPKSQIKDGSGAIAEYRPARPMSRDWRAP